MKQPLITRPDQKPKASLLQLKISSSQETAMTCVCQRSARTFWESQRSVGRGNLLFAGSRL